MLTSHLTFNTNNGLWEGTFEITPGDYVYKVAINNSWDVNYGAGGAAGGPTSRSPSHQAPPVSPSSGIRCRTS